jgi:transposase
MAIRLVLEWGEDLTRFNNGKKFASFVGFAPKEFSTGESIRRGRITGQSNPFIRAWLIECGWTVFKRDPVLLKKFRTAWGCYWK